MKIALFIELYQSGGIDTFVINLINAWPVKDDSFILVANVTYPGLQAIEARVTRRCEFVYYDAISNPDLAGMGGPVNTMKRVASPVLRYLQMGRNVVRFRAVMRRTEADVLMVINGGYPGGDMCRAAALAWGSLGGRPKSIHNFHNLAARIPWYLWVQENAVDGLLCNVTEQFVTVSGAAASSMVVRPTIFHAKRTSYIHNGLTAGRDPRAATFKIRDELGIPHAAPLCLMMGTYEPRKGHHFLFQAFKKVLVAVPSAQLIVCGFGFPYEVEQVETYRREFGLENVVHLLGFRTDVSALLDSADVLLVASQEYESFGLTSVEAMAHKVPVVATNVGGIPEVVANGEGGYCVDSRDVDGYAERIITLLLCKELRETQGELGYRRYATRFKADVMAKRYADLLHALPRHRRTSSRMTMETNPSP